MKKIGLIGLLCLCCLSGKAQKFMQLEDKAFNWGANVGFNASFPIVNSLEIDGTKLDDVRVQYKVGYLAAVFFRVNIERFFIQPSLAWYDSEGELYFNFPSDHTLNSGMAIEAKDRLTMQAKSVEMPVMIGYSLIKKGPYGLSLMVGPKLKYNYKVTYTSNIADTSQEFTTESTPWGVNIRTGVGVSIWRLFFDFVYEFGLNQVESDFREKRTYSETATHDIRIDKRTNVMSFSLGFLF